MGPLIFMLCALTALACAVLLFRGYASTRSRLLLWSGLCFSGLTLQNVIVFVDLAVFPDLDLSIARNAVGLAALCLLLFGLIWERE